MTTRRQLLFGAFGEFEHFAGRRAEPARQAAEPHIAAFGAACLAAQGIVCRSCAESCEAAAIRFVPAPGGVAHPALHADRCTGCGDCLALCPGAAIDLVARPPVSIRPSEERLA